MVGRPTASHTITTCRAVRAPERGVGQTASVDPELQSLLSVVRTDLVWLRDEWSHDLGRDAVRRASPALRLLLVDNLYGQAWRAVGLPREPVISAISLDRYDDLIESGKVTSAYAAGPTGHEAQIFTSVTVHGEIPEWMDPNRHQQLGHEHASDFPLRAFLESTCMVVEGHRVSRRELIKYVANRLGGAHFGLAGAKLATRPLFELLDKAADDGGLVLGYPLPHYLLLTVGYALARSADLEVFVAAVTAAGLPLDEEQAPAAAKIASTTNGPGSS